MKHEVTETDALTRGGEAFSRQAWAEAYAQLSMADKAAPLGIDDLEQLATSAYLIGEDATSSDLWARAHNECLRLHDVPRAVRCAFRLALDLYTRGAIAQASGWLARAQHLLDDGHHECAERGLVLVLIARVQLARGDLTSAHATARQANEVANRFDDAELKAFARLILGQVLAKSGQPAVAAALFDEVMVAATVGDVSPIAVGTVYCAVVEACHQIFDIARAREWTAALSRWCAGQPDLVSFRGTCLVHRAEIMRLSGAWLQAREEAEHARDWLSELAEKWAAPASSLPSFKFPIGAAFYELGEVHRLRGELAEAAKAYERASRSGQSPEPGLALLRLAQGRAKVAEAAVRRMLDQQQSEPARSKALAACVEIMIAVGDVPTARAAAEQLAVIARAADVPFLRALSTQSLGSVLLAEGDARAAIAELRVAWMAWQEIELPYDAARVRVSLALAYRKLGDEDATELELDAAHRVFEPLGARPDAAHVKALMRSTHGDARALTARERQVIGLVATGKTNRAIAEQLSISERTVDRHVSNILMKLDLSSRSAATAYAYEHGLV